MWGRGGLKYYWRVCAAGLAFITFIAGSVFFAFIVFPLIGILPLTSEDKQQRILQLIHWSFKTFMNYIVYLKIIEKFEVEGLQTIQDVNRCILIANHPTLIDVVAIMSCVPYCNCIVKNSLWDHLYLGAIVRAAGYIKNDHAVQLIKDCEKSFRAGQPLIIFPEGTRSPPDGLHPFQRGAAQISLRTLAPIVLVVITCDPPVLFKGQPWYRLPRRPMHLKLHFHPLQTLPTEIHEINKLPIKVRALTKYIERFFCERVYLAAEAKRG